MEKLILFDIDRTLVEGPPHDRFTRAINNLHDLGAELTMNLLDLSGLTDKMIMEAILEREGWTEEQVQESMPELLEEVDNVHAHVFKKGSIKELPGVRELLDALASRGAALGLVTGNLETIAERKLNDVDLWEYFPFGGFGNDPHVTRGDLVMAAIEKSGFTGYAKDIYVVGDTVRDVAAAHEAGITNSVAVSNGYRPVQELIDGGAKIVLKDFKNTEEVLFKFGI